jgi:hypothetical protein
MLLTDWIEANNQAVAKSYPQFRTVEPPAGSGAILAWRGAIAPLRGSKELGFILDDLTNSADVLVQAGKLIHDPFCRRIHSRPKFLDSIQSIDSSFQLNLLAFPPKHHPKAFCIAPEISKRSYPFHPHLHLDSSVCAYQPSDKVLPWDGRTMTAFLNYISIWSAKHIVWQQTGANQAALWIGPAAGHMPHEILRDVGRNDPCPCGSGLKFKRCHLGFYQQQSALMEGRFGRGF